MQKYDYEGYPIAPNDPSTPKFYLIAPVDALIAEHIKDWEDAAKERVQHLTRIAELEKAVNRGIEALSRCYDVTEWPADHGSFQLTVLNDLKSLMER